MNGLSNAVPLPAAARGQAPQRLQRGRVGPRAAGAARRRRRAPELGRNKATVKGRVVKSAIGECWSIVREREAALPPSTALALGPLGESHSHSRRCLYPTLPIPLNALLVSPT